MIATSYLERTTWINTVQCSYNMVGFLQYPYNRHPIAHLQGLGMGCLLWV